MELLSPRAKSKRIQKIDTKIKPLLTINKLLAPSGCAKTIKPMIDNIDSEIMETINHNQKFYQKIQREYSKLNFPIEINISPARNIKNCLPKAKSLIASNHLLSQEKCTFKERNIFMSIEKASPTHKVICSSVDPFRSKDSPKFERLTPFLKSTPISIAKDADSNKKQKSCGGMLNLIRLKSVNSIISKCRKSRRSFVRSIERGMKFLKEESGDITNYLDDLIDHVKFSKNDDYLDNPQSKWKHIKKINRSLTKESKIIQQELYESAHRIISIQKSKSRQSRNAVFF